MNDTKKPKVTHSMAEKELDKVQEQFDKFDGEIKEMTMDRMNLAPKQDLEPQTKIAQSDIAKMNDVYIKPKRTISSKEKFNEKYRSEYEFAKEYVCIIAENKEMIGETLEFWSKPFPGMPCEEWAIPSNKPVNVPRYVAEQIKRKYYHRLVMKENVTTQAMHMGQFYGSMAADTTVQRLDAIPVSNRKSIFMGSNNFN